MLHNLNFALDSIEEIESQEQSLYEQKKKDRFVNVKIKAFSDGENAHTQPVDFEVLQKSADSIYDIPLICELNYMRNNEDFGTHGLLTGSEFSFGFVKKSNENPIVFEKDEETNKTFLTIYGTIWKKYFNNIVEILQNKGNTTEVSVEMDAITEENYEDGEKPTLKQFIFNAITFLGNITSAACKGAEATLVFAQENAEQFAKEKEEYMKKFEEAKTIEIDNSKESAIDSKSWSNPKQKLLAPILAAKNTDSLLKEAYLIVDNKGGEEITLSDVKYPHHTVTGDKLVLNIKGLQAAFARASQQGIVKGAVKDHLMRHYKELGLSTENFEEFGFSKEEYEEYFSDFSRKEEDKLGTLTANTKKGILESAIRNATQSDIWVRDFDDEFVYYVDYKADGMFKAPYELIAEGDEAVAMINVEERQPVVCTEVYVPLTKEQVFACEKFAEDNGIDFNKEAIEALSVNCEADVDKDDVRTETTEEEHEPLHREDGEEAEETIKDNQKLVDELNGGEVKVEGESEDDKDEVEEADEAEDKAEEAEEKKDDEFDGDAEAQMSYEELVEKCATLEAKLAECEDKLADMCDYDELKAFKEETIAAQNEAQELAEMALVIEQLEAKGIQMSEDEIKEAYAKRDEFANVTGWSNYIKSVAFDKIDSIKEEDAGIIAMALAEDNTKKDETTQTVWDSLKSNI